MESSPLKPAIHAIKSGDRANGQRLLAELVKSEPNNELAWLWLSVCFDDPHKKKFCLNRTLTINPANLSARRALEQMEHAAAGTPAHTAAAIPRAPATGATQPVATVPPVTGPAASVSEAPAQPAIPQKTSEIKALNSRWPVYLLLAVVFLLVCLGESFFVAQRLYRLLNNQISSQFGHVSQAPATPSASSPRNFNRIGIFLLEGSQTLELQRSTLAPASGLPATQDKRPALVLNDPQLSIPDLKFAAVAGNTVLKQIPLQSEPYLGTVLAIPGQDLENGVYCLIQYSSSPASGLEPRWCFQVSQTGSSPPGQNDLSTLNVAPPGDGFFLIEQDQAVALLAYTQDRLDFAILANLPSTANRQPVIIIKSAGIDLASVKWNETLWGVGIRDLDQVDSNAPGAEIGTVIDGTPAAQANVRYQDILLAINGQPLDTGASGKIDNYGRLRGQPGTMVKITVRKATQALELQLPRTSMEDIREIEFEVIQKTGYVYLVPKTNLRPGVYYLNDYGHDEDMYFQIQ